MSKPAHSELSDSQELSRDSKTPCAFYRTPFRRIANVDFACRTCLKQCTRALCTSPASYSTLRLFPPNLDAGTAVFIFRVHRPPNPMWAWSFLATLFNSFLTALLFRRTSATTARPQSVVSPPGQPFLRLPFSDEIRSGVNFFRLNGNWVFVDPFTGLRRNGPPDLESTFFFSHVSELTGCTMEPPYRNFSDPQYVPLAVSLFNPPPFFPRYPPSITVHAGPLTAKTAAVDSGVNFPSGPASFSFLTR